MMRRVTLLLLLAAVAPAARAGEGVYITLDGGYALWNKDELKKNLAARVGNDPVTGLSNAALLVDQQLPDGGLFALHLGYNIGGHVAFEGGFTIRPWDALSDTRGAAFLTGLATRWFPLQGLVRPNRQFDLSLLAGADYTLTGGNGIKDANGKRIDNSGRGFDGIAIELGGTVELYPAKWVSLGITPRWYVLDPLRYFISFDKRDTGGALPLLGKIGGSLFSITASVAFHFEPLPD